MHETSLEPVDDKPAKWIAGFWRRLLAFIIDAVLLGVAGTLVGFVLHDFFVQLGPWGRLVGFIMSLSYLGIMNSAIAGGQTLGKRIMTIRVVDSENQPIELVKSLLRSSVIVTVFTLNGAGFSVDFLNSIFIYPVSLIVFGGLFSLLYLVVFNRATRQSLHDLLLDTFVVNAKIDQKEIATVWVGHRVMVVLFFIAAAVVPAFSVNMTEDTPLAELMAVQRMVSEHPDVRVATVTQSAQTNVNSEKDVTKSSHVTARVVLLDNNIDDARLARELAEMMVRQYPNALTTDGVQVILTFGFDIGIASQWKRNNYRFASTTF